MAHNDLGTVLSQAHGGSTTGLLDTSYNPGAAFYAGASNVLKFYVAATDAGTSNITSINVKLQESYDGTNYFDVATSKSDGTADNTVEQSLSTSAGTTARCHLYTTRHVAGLYHRLSVKANGGATKADDAVAITAVVG